MGTQTEPRTRARGSPAIRALALVLVAVTVLGIAAPVGSHSVGSSPDPRAVVALASPQNGSTGGDPSGAGTSALCPSPGPVVLGIVWSCVAVLDLTELALILASIGIVAYVFKDADRAELPGECAEVPVTAEEWEAYRRARKLAAPNPPRPPPGGNEGS